MAKKAKKGNGKAKAALKSEQRTQSAPKAKEAHKPQAPDLDALRKPVLDANAGLTKAEAEAKAMVDKAVGLVAKVKAEYREALAPCRTAKLAARPESSANSKVDARPT